MLKKTRNPPAAKKHTKQKVRSRSSALNETIKKVPVNIVTSVANRAIAGKAT